MSEKDDEEKPDKKLVGVRVEPKRHERWTEFVEESDEFGSLAQVLRVGVESVINDEEDDLDEQLDMLRDELELLRQENRRTREAVEEVPEKVDGATQVAEEVIYRLEEFEGDLE